FASTLGLGVVFSVLTILIYEGRVGPPTQNGET
ncbi:unnamed protein product, partial [marine sediment metagenome]